MRRNKYNQSLAQAHPEIAAEWAYDLNHPGIPEEFAPRSGKAVHWRCREGHTWRATIAQRTRSEVRLPLLFRPALCPGQLPGRPGTGHRGTVGPGEQR